MIELAIPGRGELWIRHVVLDYNGTMAKDGELLDGVARAVEALAGSVKVHVVTADTFGSVTAVLGDLPCRIRILSEGRQDEAKRDYVRGLGAESVVCVGNGRNDRLMLEEAALGVAVIQEEGCAAEALMAADVVCRSLIDALSLLVNPKRLAATLRS